MISELVLLDHVPEVLIALFTHSSFGPNKAQLLRRSQSDFIIGVKDDKVALQRCRHGAVW